MNNNRKSYRVNGEEVVVESENSLYNGIPGTDNVKGALDWLRDNGGGGGDTPSTLKVLTIGNSFCQNLFMYINGILSNLNISGVTIYNLFRGGMTPHMWWDYYNRDDNGFDIEYKCGTHITAIESLTGESKNVAAVVAAVEWDVVIIQQFHSGTPGYSGLVGDLTDLVAHIRHDCPNRKVKVGMNMEWPRSINSTQNGPKGILGYEAIVTEIQAALDGGNIDIIVPNGTAVMNASYNSALNTLMPAGSTYASDKAAEEGGTTHDENLLLLSQATNDKLHLANGVGKYVVAATFVEAIIRPWCGISIVGSTYTASAYQSDAGSIAVTATNRGLCHAAALYAVANPFDRSVLNPKNF